MTTEALSFQPTPIVTFGYIMQILFSLVIIVGFMYLAARYILPKLKIANTGKHIKIIDRIHLEPQVSAYLIKVGGETWLIGTSNKQIAKIDKINEDDLK